MKRCQLQQVHTTFFGLKQICNKSTKRCLVWEKCPSPQKSCFSNSSGTGLFKNRVSRIALVRNLFSEKKLWCGAIHKSCFSNSSGAELFKNRVSRIALVRNLFSGKNCVELSKNRVSRIVLMRSFFLRKKSLVWSYPKIVFLE